MVERVRYIEEGQLTTERNKDRFASRRKNQEIVIVNLNHSGYRVESRRVICKVTKLHRNQKRKVSREEFRLDHQRIQRRSGGRRFCGSHQFQPGTMSVILLSSITSALKIQNKGVKLGTLTPMNQVLWRTHLLEATLMGYGQKIVSNVTENKNLYMGLWMGLIVQCCPRYVYGAVSWTGSVELLWRLLVHISPVYMAL